MLCRACLFDFRTHTLPVHHADHCSPKLEAAVGAATSSAQQSVLQYQGTGKTCMHGGDSIDDLNV